MAVTIKDIAEMVGVSRGTVDRALHDRGRVDPEVARRIKQTARELGFEPSRAGRALALAKKPLKLGVVVHLTKTGFMQQLLQGIEDARAELAALGVEVRVREVLSADAGQESQAIDGLLAWGAQGLAISAVDDAALRAKVDEVVGGTPAVPVITFNTDLPGSRRACFVGQDALRGGRTAADLMRKLCGGAGPVAIVTGYLTSHGHNRRVEGFMKELAGAAPGMQVTGVQVCYDEDDEARRVTRQVLESHPGLGGLFVAAGGQAGVCDALREAGRQDVKLIVYDVLPATMEGLEDGTVDFVIDQNAAEQGGKPLRLLFDMLFSGAAVEREMYDTGIIIKCKYNL